MLRFFSAVVIISAIAAPVFSGQAFAAEEKKQAPVQKQAQTAPKNQKPQKEEKKADAPKDSAPKTDSPDAKDEAGNSADSARYDQDSANKPERTAECLWTGQRIVSLLLRDDINTAREHMNFYDRFGCPKDYITVAFRCSILQAERQPQQTDIAARVYGCWMSPEVADRQ